MAHGMYAIDDVRLAGPAGLHHMTPVGFCCRQEPRQGTTPAGQSQQRIANIETAVQLQVV